MRLPVLKEKSSSNYLFQFVVGIILAFVLVFVFAKFLFGVALGIIVGVPIGALLYNLQTQKGNQRQEIITTYAEKDENMDTESTKNEIKEENE